MSGIKLNAKQTSLFLLSIVFLYNYFICFVFYKYFTIAVIKVPSFNKGRTFEKYYISMPGRNVIKTYVKMVLSYIQ